MAPYDKVLNGLDASDPTCKLAQSLYRQASELTKQGSGRSTGQGQHVLFAICAFLASQRLGNGDVTREQARAVACIDLKTFDYTMNNVEKALATSSSKTNRPTITYMSLLKQYVSREDAFVPMKEVEDALKTHETLVDGSPNDLDSPLMQCAIFYWVCTVVLRVTTPDARHLRQTLQFPIKKWVTAQRTLEKHCAHMVEDLTRNADTAFAALRTRITRSQRRETNREVDPPSGNFPTRPEKPPFPPISTPQGPIVQTVKRKAAEIESKENESPPRRHKASNHIASSSGRGLTIQTPPKAKNNITGLCTPSQVDMDDEGNVEPPHEVIIVRSTRLSTRPLDQTPWSSHHPSVAAQKCTPLTQSNPSVRLAVINTTPMTDTGMSVTSSPCSPARLSVRVPGSSVPRTCFPRFQEEQDMPRRRRRNLCATFLDPGAYGWRPTVHTIQKLEWARKWEKLMTDKYGDPWDIL